MRTKGNARPRPGMYLTNSNSSATRQAGGGIPNEIDCPASELSLLPYKRYYISNAYICRTKKEYQTGDYLYTWYLSSSTPIEPIMDDVPVILPCHFDITPFAEFGRHADREDNISKKKPIVMRTWKNGAEPVSIELEHSLHNPPLLIAENLKATTFNGISLSAKHTASFLLDPPISEAAH